MKRIGLFLFMIIAFLTSCKKDGCIDPTALNYDPNAKNDDGSCVYLVDNLNFKFYSKLGTQDFAYGTEAQLSSGRKVKFSKAQMYLSGFTFNGAGGPYELLDPHVLLQADVQDYNLGYLPLGAYTSFSFAEGVDSVANHSDPASFPSSSALSSNNPDYMHWAWNSGYIFLVLEGTVDTTAAMNGNTDAAFVYHIGLDENLVEMAFAKDFNSVAEGFTIEMDVDWLKLLDGTNMVGADTTRSTHTMDNPSLASLVISNVDGAFSLH
ncbi:MAG: hypothetical protein GC178_14500 [Flavobacteriales bacterium]|nr:hypothetical protein [Flavobacteriales bacterium]